MKALIRLTVLAGFGALVWFILGSYTEAKISSGTCPHLNTSFRHFNVYSENMYIINGDVQHMGYVLLDKDGHLPFFKSLTLPNSAANLRVIGVFAVFTSERNDTIYFIFSCGGHAAMGSYKQTLVSIPYSTGNETIIWSCRNLEQNKRDESAVVLLDFHSLPSGLSAAFRFLKSIGLDPKDFYNMSKPLKNTTVTCDYNLLGAEVPNIEFLSDDMCATFMCIFEHFTAARKPKEKKRKPPIRTELLLSLVVYFVFLCIVTAL